MPTVLTEKLVLDDVVKYIAHPAYNIDIGILNNGSVALSVGDSLLGKLALFVSGTTWKVLDSGDSITTTSNIVVIMHSTKVLAAAAGDAAGILAKCPLLVRGPAAVHRDVIDFASLTEATVIAALLNNGIKVVDETGLTLEYEVI